MQNTLSVYCRVFKGADAWTGAELTEIKFPDWALGEYLSMVSIRKTGRCRPDQETWYV